MNITLHDITMFLLGMAVSGILLCIGDFMEEKKQEKELRRKFNYYR